MKGWETIKVKQCFKFRNGKSFNGILKEKADNEYCYPVYGGNGVIGYCKTPLLKEPTLIVGRVGEYCGNVFKTQSESWVTDNAMLVNEILLKDFNIDFWAIKLNSLQFNHYSDSTGQPKVTQGGIGAISFTYPINNEEQTAIANILSKVDETIAAVQNSIDSAERLKKKFDAKSLNRQNETRWHFPHTRRILHRHQIRQSPSWLGSKENKRCCR